jgi:hypothetical protein
VLEPEVVVQAAREVLLDAEEELLRFLLRDLAFRFGGLLEIAFLAVFLERHGTSKPFLDIVRPSQESSQLYIATYA